MVLGASLSPRGPRAYGVGVGSNGKRVAVLFHARGRDVDPRFYLVHTLAGVWRERGLEVICVYGTDRFVPADLALVHVDLSVVPEEYLEFAAQYPIVLNGRVRDIRKTTTSRHLVRPGDDWEGPVIVKSNLNYGGRPEYRNSLTGIRRWRVSRALASRAGASPVWSDYRVFDRLADVPASVFERSDLVVERFLPDVENGLYHIQIYQFLGDGERCSRLGSPSPLLKAEDCTCAQTVEPHPAARAWREELGLDYGKIDYIARDGEAILLDANKTTGTATYGDPGELAAQRRKQANGIHSYFAGGRPL
jgi:hypothetical protein